MFKIPEQRGFSYSPHGHYVGFRAGAEHFRAGLATYAWLAYQWPGLGHGRCPARYLRLFKEKGDAHGEYAMLVETLWCLNYEMLIKLPGAIDAIKKSNEVTGLAILLRAREHNEPLSIPLCGTASCVQRPRVEQT